MKIFFVVAAMIGSIVLFNANAGAQSPAARPAAISSETRELVRNFLEANGMRTSMVRIFEDIIRQAPSEAQAELRVLLRGDAIIDNLIPIYAKHFTNEELRELIRFYKSPVGAKNRDLTPVLMNEVMQASQQYFQESVSKLESNKAAGSSR